MGAEKIGNLSDEQDEWEGRRKPSSYILLLSSTLVPNKQHSIITAHSARRRNTENA